MSAEEHIGQGHESEPYIDLFRGISPEVHHETLIREKSASFDEGWRACADSMICDLRANKRAFGRRLEARSESAYRQFRRRFAFNFLTVATILLVMVVAIGYLSEVSK